MNGQPSDVIVGMGLILMTLTVIWIAAWLISIWFDNR